MLFRIGILVKQNKAPQHTHHREHILGALDHGMSEADDHPALDCQTTTTERVNKNETSGKEV